MNERSDRDQGKPVVSGEAHPQPGCHEPPTTAHHCCHEPAVDSPKEGALEQASCHGSHSSHKDTWLLIALGLISFFYISHLAIDQLAQLLPESPTNLSAANQFKVQTFSHTVFELVNRMSWGIALGIIMMSLLAKIPRELVVFVLGSKRGSQGILRATAAGVLLDLCNHGILLVAASLYERGVSIGQVIAFLIASPWNSFSFTLILIALIGLPWTLAFILLSMGIAIVVGLIFDRLVAQGSLPENPNQVELSDNFQFWPTLKDLLKTASYHPRAIIKMLSDGIKQSQMVLRWIFIGILLAGLVRTFVPVEYFQAYFGPTMMGLGLTLVAATALEVCSEGSIPLAADLFNRAAAPGNSFAFLMTGVATDYTEIAVLKETTQSWHVSLLLPALTIPQVIVIAWLINAFA